jgi:hypothetical protein
MLAACTATIHLHIQSRVAQKVSAQKQHKRCSSTKGVRNLLAIRQHKRCQEPFSYQAARFSRVWRLRLRESGGGFGERRRLPRDLLGVDHDLDPAIAGLSGVRGVGDDRVIGAVAR